MELNKGHMIFGAACLIAGIVLGVGFRSCGKPTKPVPAESVIIHDTLTITDTLRIAAHTKPKYVIRHDTLWLLKPASPCDSVDSVCDGRVTNSIAVEAPITQSVYRDTFQTDSSRIELGIEFSGWHAQIDGINLKSQYTIQPRTIEKKKGWGQFIGIGVGVGYGASVVGNRVYAAPEIGVHITYGFGYTWKK